MKNRIFQKQSTIVSFGLLLFVLISCDKEDAGPDIIKDSFTDARDNNVYATVTIGNQTWMAENLKYLPEVSAPDSGSGSMKIKPYYYVYDYYGTSVAEAKATMNYDRYGVLYNWPAANEACPRGWHLPGQEEWQELFDYIESNGYELKAGKALKSSHDWNENGGGTDNFGFSALPGGYRGSFYSYNYSSGHYGFGYMGEVGFFWTSTVYSVHDSWCKLLVSGYDGLYRSAYYYDEGFCVRCIKDN